MSDWVPLALWHVLALVGLGLVGGTLGGFLGIGGGVLFLPMMKLLADADPNADVSMHMAKAGALVVQVFIGASAARNHLKSGHARPRMLKVLIPAAMAASIVGVLVANMFTGDMEVWLWRLFGGVMLYVVLLNLWRFFRRDLKRGKLAKVPHTHQPSHLSVGGVGTAMGLSSGLLGIGGGSVAGPAQQVLLKQRLRTAIANASIATMFSCVLAAIVQHVTLPAGSDRIIPLLYIVLLTPGAVVGGYVGSKLSPKAPKVFVRVVFILFLTWTAYRTLTTT